MFHHFFPLAFKSSIGGVVNQGIHLIFIYLNLFMFSSISYWLLINCWLKFEEIYVQHNTT